MDQELRSRLSRRALMGAAFATAIPLAAATCSGRQMIDAQAATAGTTPTRRSGDQVAPGQAPEQVLEPTPECVEGGELTVAQTEGPYFTRNSPERTSLLEDGLTGTKLALTGRVLTQGCQPVASALLDFWQADDAGRYDNRGYTLRGHQFTDETGAYRLETIVPGLYPGRTRHIHVKVQAPNGPVLTSQLYFPNEPGNARDRIYDPRLEMAVQDAEDGQHATFDFVVRTA